MEGTERLASEAAEHDGGESQIPFKWVPAMAVEVVTLDGRGVRHGEINGRDNVVAQFINLAGGEECALLIKESVLDKDGAELGITKDSIYPVRNLIRTSLLRREVEKKDDAGG